MERLTTGWAKLLYGFLFVVVLPILLVLWATHTKEVVPLPALHSLPWGFAASATGFLLMALGMTSLWRLGGGLPMNAFPPQRHVSTGIYGLFQHPIYVGFVCLCAGVSIAYGSASGLWLITPLVALGAVALVLGYELPDMQRRFGQEICAALPPDDHAEPKLQDRFRCYLTVLLPWFLLYEAFVLLGIPPDARIAYFSFESHLPVPPWTEIFYASAYVIAILVPLLVPTNRELRRFSTSGLLSMILVFPTYFAVPLIAPPRPFAATGTLGQIMTFDRAHDSASAAFPSYHVIWAFIAAAALSRNRWQKWMGFLWALLVSASCIATGMHAVADVLAGGLVAAIVLNADTVWLKLLRLCERIANSWHEWRIGPLRIINHGAYAAAGVFAGMLIIDTLLGPGKSVITLSIFLGGAIGSALWAQWIEASPSLLRPLGFYGGMIGTVIAGVSAALVSKTSVWLTLAALVVAAPWVQGIGRLRCLVQGCCHGRPAAKHLGITYTHPLSRVWRIASLHGVPIYPTPLYSLLWNIGIAVVVTRLYLVHSATSLIGGLYLILSGLGRFAEEAYRGEPQTPVRGGLRLYQWVAMLTVPVGAFVTTIASAPLPSRPVPHASSLVVAAACGVLAWCVSGIDFPESYTRFARLT